MVKKEYVASLTYLILVGALLTFAAIVFFHSSLAWFAYISDVSGNGIGLSVKGLPKTEQYLMIDGVRIEDSATEIFAGMVPGDVVTLQVYIKNKEDSPIAIDLIMEAPTSEQDQPYVIDGLYHYFGTQLRINSIKNQGDDILELSGTERYLLTLDPSQYIGNGNSLPPTSINYEIDFSILASKTLASGVEIPANSEIILEIDIEFVDNLISQNPYIEHGNSASSDPEKSALILARTLSSHCYYVD